MYPFRPLKSLLTALLCCVCMSAESQTIIAQNENLPFKTNVPSNGPLSNQFSAFIVGEKPVALHYASFSAYNKSEAKKLSVSIYKGLINGNNATLLSKVAASTVNVETTNDFKTFNAFFGTNILLESWGVYYIVVHNESAQSGEVTVAMASNIGAVKANGVTALSGVFNQDVPVTGTAKGLVDNNAFIGVSLNGPQNAPAFTPPAPDYNLQRFSGTVQRGKALLQWKIEHAEMLRSSVLEKSADQNNFQEISAGSLFGGGTYIDQIKGKAFYRLKLTDATGKISYSKIVKLESKSFFTAKLQQTQLNKGETIRLELSSSETLQTLVTIVNRFGQPVKKLSQQVMPGYTNIQLSSSDLPSGNYYVRCSGGASNEYVSEIQMIVL